MKRYQTNFGTIDAFEKGGIEIVNDDPKNYVFSNIFEVAAHAKPYERIAVAKNFEYVIEAVRAEGTSPWYSAAHDEFALAMDGEVQLHLVKLNEPDRIVDPNSEGAHRLADLPPGKKMGRIILRRGHMALLPVGSAYRFTSQRPATLMIQTVAGPETIERWDQICIS